MQRCGAAPPHGQSSQRKAKVLIVTGATGVGKTESSLLLAERLNGEIISADSVQVYRGLDVGSDKLPLSERRGIPHHLIDVSDVTEDFSAGDFYDHARRITEDIIQRGKTPIVVGGTGFYLRMYMFGKPRSPKASAGVAQEAERLILEAQVATATALGVDVTELPDHDKWEGSVDTLLALGDSVSADRVRLERNNWYRLRRALEVVLTTGKPMIHAAMALNAEPSELDFDFRPFFLSRPRLETFARIDSRVEHMARPLFCTVLGGLLDEAKQLIDRGLQPNGCMATRAIGYKQAMEWLLAVRERGRVSDADIVQLVLDIQAASRGLLKSQFTFHRDIELFKWVDAQAGVEAAVAEIADLVAAPEHQGGVLPGSGRLTKEEQYMLHRYRCKLELFDQREHLDFVWNWLRRSGYLASPTELRISSPGQHPAQLARTETDETTSKLHKNECTTKKR